MIFKLLSDLDLHVTSGNWEGLEQYGSSICAALAGEAQATKIARQDFSQYQIALASAMGRALDAARRPSARAIYFEYDMDNSWQSAFFICTHYNPPTYGDDDWAADWKEVIPGPSFPELSGLYLENGFDRSNSATGSTIFLVARTVAAFGRAIEGLDCGRLAVCIAFHDQDPVFRIREVQPV